ncbi:MAG: hypothetical protein HY225_00300 [Candidatus Vogelbacteria bacterium]|nr:hypothetical protein [Candidatus Vogelbacteria bacterium]
MLSNPYKIVGAIGLTLITAGILIKDRKKEDLLYILGGLLLEIYSIYIKDTLFITLQIIFTISAIYDYTKSKNSARPK